MNYVALYRKYRPYKLSEVVGQNTIVELLKNIIKNDKISHAYIFSGPRGTGKTSIAKIFARSVNCLNPIDGDICGQCEMCKKMQDNNIDIIEIDAASNNGVDEIREIRENSKLVPNLLRYKVYIIDEAHMLSTSAFNALLKTLEEPPKHVIFILATTEINKIPLTVISRCMRLDFKKIDDKSLFNRLKYILDNENKTLSEDVLNEIIRISNGGLRDAINYLDQALSIDNMTIEKLYDLTGEIEEKNIKQMFVYILESNIPKILEKINEYVELSKNFDLIAEKMLIFIRDALINQSIPDYFDNEYSKDLSIFTKIDSDKLYDVSKLLINLSSELKKSNNQKLIFEIHMIMISEKLAKISEKTDLYVSEKTETEEVIIKKEESENNKLSDNIDYINKEIRINNAFVSASKEVLKEYQNKYKDLDNYLFDKKYNNIAKLLSSGEIVLASEKNIVIKFESNANINMFYINNKLINKLLGEVLEKKVLTAAVDNVEWEQLKSEYIKNIKSDYKYVKMDEIKLKKSNNKDTIELAAENLFGEENISIK